MTTMRTETTMALDPASVTTVLPPVEEELWEREDPVEEQKGPACAPDGEREAAEGRKLCVHYRRGEAYAREMAFYIVPLLDPEREFLLDRTHRVMVQAMRELVTPREAECMELYYVQALNYRQIGVQLGINVSTISRNIQRGECKIKRILTLTRALLGQDAA